MITIFVVRDEMFVQPGLDMVSPFFNIINAISLIIRATYP